MKVTESQAGSRAPVAMATPEKAAMKMRTMVAMVRMPTARWSRAGPAGSRKGNR